MGLVEGTPVEPARILPLEHLGPYVAAYGVVALVAQHGRHQQHGAGDRIVHQSHAAQRADDEQQRVAGQKGHDHHARLHEDDEKQQRVHPGSIGHDEGLQVLVYVQDEVDQELNDFQKKVLRGGRRTGPYCTSPACPHSRARANRTAAHTGACMELQMLGIAPVLLHNLIKLYEKLTSASAFAGKVLACRRHRRPGLTTIIRTKGSKP